MNEASFLDELNRATWSAADHPTATPEEIAPFLLVWLRQEMDEARADYASPPTRLPGGTDTQTFHFRLSGVEGKLSEPLVLRLYYPAHGAARALREARIQKALAPTAIPVPDVHFTCTDASILGGPFFIMEYLAGKSLALAGLDVVPVLLARTQLLLHGLDPAPVLESLRAQGESPAPRLPGDELVLLADHARKHPSLAPVIGWMEEHAPDPPARPALCHGDFHPLNLAARDGKVTGVFDWAEFMVADPAADVANTLHMSIPARRLFGLDHDGQAEKRYLECYRREAHISESVLEWYRVKRSVVALLAGAGGRMMWRHPGICHDLLAGLRARTGATLDAPPWDI